MVCNGSVELLSCVVERFLGGGMGVAVDVHDRSQHLGSLCGLVSELLADISREGRPASLHHLDDQLQVKTGLAAHHLDVLGVLWDETLDLGKEPSQFLIGKAWVTIVMPCH